MEQAMNSRKHSPLRRTFCEYVLLTFVLIVVLSSVVIVGCGKVQNWLLPENNECYLTIEKNYADGTTETSSHLMEIGEDAKSLPILTVKENNTASSSGTVKYSIKPYGKDPSLLTPKRRLLYRFCSAATIAIPMLLSFMGILLCGMLFYKKKLQVPIEILSNAAKQIANKQLDFTISYDCEDELGELCSSFETMRYILAENNKEMWRMVEDRRKMQASVAHDLRNPIAIVKGYAEYLKLGIPLGQIDNAKTLEIAEKIERVAHRMDAYTESVRRINHLEELLPCKNVVSTKDCIHSLTSDAEIMCSSEGITVCVNNQVTRDTISTDVDILSRIIENLISNSIRYAKGTVTISFLEEDDELVIEIADDGCGFSKEILSGGGNIIHSRTDTDGHLGIGLYICKIFCCKLDGRIKLYNRKNGGAAVKLVFPF